MDIKTLERTDFTRGYKLIDRVLTRIKSREGGQLGIETFRTELERQGELAEQAPHKERTIIWS